MVVVPTVIIEEDPTPIEIEPTVQPQVQPQVQTQVQVQPKKRGRKPNDYSIKSAEPVRVTQNIILHLPIKLSEIKLRLESNSIEKILKEHPTVIVPCLDTQPSELIHCKTSEFHSTMTRRITRDGQYKLVEMAEGDNDNDDTAIGGSTLLDFDGEIESECESTKEITIQSSSSIEDTDTDTIKGTYTQGTSTNVIVTKERYQPSSSYRSQSVVTTSSLKVYDIKTFPLELTSTDPNSIEQFKSVRVDTCCWHCVHSFDTMPVYLPVSFDNTRKQFRVKGCFCSFNCVMAYGLNDRQYYNEAKSLTRYMYKIITGKTDYFDIKPAPSRYTLKMFGGILDIHEFRETFATLNKYNVTEYPVINIVQQIEQIQIKVQRRTDFNPASMVPSSMGTSFAEKKPLRLQRTNKKNNGSVGFNQLMGIR